MPESALQKLFFVCACVHVCVRACVRACVRVCVLFFVMSLGYIKSFIIFIFGINCLDCNSLVHIIILIYGGGTVFPWLEISDWLQEVLYSRAHCD